MCKRMTPFGDWLADHGISYADAARALGVSRAYVQAMAVGKATPRIDTLGAQIEAWTRGLSPDTYVPAESWLPYCKAFQRFQNLKQTA